MRSARRFLVLGLLALAAQAFADSVVPVATTIRISRPTVTLIDPLARPGSGTSGTDTAIRVGDILTFVIQFTPVANGASRAMGGYITTYIPANTEVVGVRFIDRNGNTVSPRRAGLAPDGVGPRGPAGYSAPLVEGSISQLYADTGIFFSLNARTARRSRNPVSGIDEPFLSLNNGVQMPQNPSGAAQFDPILATTAPYFAHNEWDLAQVLAFGTGAAGAIRSPGGFGNTPEHIANTGIGYGSPVAGPESWYQLEATVDPSGSSITVTSAKALGNVGPWMRVRTSGGEIGRRGAGDNPPTATQGMPSPGLPTRIGVLAADMSGTPFGWDLSPDNPLPAQTNAVRFAIGELVLGEEYYAELSLRVKALPLDPVSGMDIVCAEAFGGDASSRSQAGTSGGLDNMWRYFVPAPACVVLNLQFEKTVNKAVAVAGDSLTYTITVKNLSTTGHTNVTVKDCFDPAALTFVSAVPTPQFDVSGSGCPNPGGQDALVWVVGSLAAGANLTFTAQFTVNAGPETASNHAVYTSDSLPAPSFVARAATTISFLPVIGLQLAAAPSHVPALPGLVLYTGTVTNTGTGTASTSGCTGSGCFIEVVLPAGFTFRGGTAVVNGVPVANPLVSGQSVRFPASLLPTSIAREGTLTIEFDADVAAGTPAGLYHASLSSWLRNPSSGQDIENSIAAVAPVAVLTQRSEAPLLSSPILSGATTVTGTTTEMPGSTIRVFVNGNPAGNATSASGGAFAVTVPRLFAGQQVTATAKSTGEIESPLSSPVVVSLQTFTLTVTKMGIGSGVVTSGPGGISCGADCSEPYDSGTVVTLTATSAGSSAFTGWSGACTGTGSCMVTMDAAKSVTGTFSAPGTVILTVTKTGAGSGTVTSSAAGISCTAGTCATTFNNGATVILTAAAASGSIFGGWTGGGCSGTGGCSVTLNADTTVTATFVAVVGSSLAQCQSDLATALQQTQSLQDQLNTCQAQRNDLQAQVFAAQTSITNLQDRIAALTLQNQDLAQQNAQTRTQLAVAQQTITGLNAQISQLQGQIATVTQQVRTLTNALNADLGTMQQDLAQTFGNPQFQIPGATPTDKLQNLINAILKLNKGRKEGIYMNLGGRQRPQ